MRRPVLRSKREEPGGAVAALGGAGADGQETARAVGGGGG